MNTHKPAKTCFGHIGGKLGSLLLDAFIDKGWIAKKVAGDKHYYITKKGEKAFTDLGIDISAIADEKHTDNS